MDSPEKHVLYSFLIEDWFSRGIWCLNYWWNYWRRIGNSHDHMDVRNLNRTKYLYTYKCFLSKDVCTSHSVMSDSLPLHDCSPPSFSAHGIPQASILEWVAIPTSQTRDQTQLSCTAGRFFITPATWEALSKDEENKIK